MPNVFPSTTLGANHQTQPVVKDDIVILRSTYGNARGRVYYSGRKLDFPVVVYAYLTAAQLTQLLADYDANRTLTVLFTWQGDNVQRTCIFTAPPKPEALQTSPIAYKVTLGLTEV